MKNLHLLQIDTTSRLVKIYNDVNRETFTLKLDVEVNDSFKEYVNVYITSDEEIKEGDWHLHYYEGKPIVSKSHNSAVKGINEIAEQFGYKKVILTTDQDLINDGVQEINDGFLEWFVKNPNCNFVRAIKVPYFDESNYSYVLIIPLEEDFELVSIGEETVKLAIPMIQDREEIKQETLEEAAERLYPTTINSFTDSGFDMSETERLIFINGAKWQQERMYSEEEVRKMFSRYNEVIAHRDNEEWQAWIDKQFKKK